MPKLNPIERNLLYSSNLVAFGTGMLGPLFAVFAEKVGGNVLSVSWAWATYLIVSGIFVVIIGNLSDSKFKKEKIMITGYILSIVFTFAYLLVSSPWHLFVVQAGLGLAKAMMKPTWESLYAKYEDKGREGLAWGLGGGEYMALSGLAIIVGGLIINYYSFNALFVTMGVAQIIATFYQARIFKLKAN